MSAMARAAGMLGAITTAAIAIWMSLGSGTETGRTPGSQSQTHQAAVPLQLENADFAVVTGHRAVPSRWVVATREARPEWLVNDDEAVDLLRAAGAGKGLLRIDDSVQVVGGVDLGDD